MLTTKSAHGDNEGASHGRGFEARLRSIESFRNGVTGEARGAGEVLERLRSLASWGLALASDLVGGVAGREMTGRDTMNLFPIPLLGVLIFVCGLTFVILGYSFQYRLSTGPTDAR